jgi:thymidylate synthase
MAQIDKEYNELLQRILREGTIKGDRTGTGTLSIFEHTLRYDMSNGFPLLTTKKMFTKGVISELLWFLKGNTELRDLINEKNYIWVGDAYKRYKVHIEDMNMTEREPNDPKHILSKDEFIERIKTNDEFNRTWGNLGPIYGKQWVNWGGYEIVSGEVKEGLNKGINQIQGVLDTLKNNPDGRRMLVTAWNPADIPDMILPPCHWAFELYTEELTENDLVNVYIRMMNEKYPKVVEENGIDLVNDTDWLIDKLTREGYPTRKISLKWHQRSVDVPLGLPFNIASYAFLLEMFAQQVNMVPHMLIGDLTNVHIYKDQMDGVIEQIERNVDGYEAPKLKLDNSFIVDAGDNGERMYKDMFSYKLEDFKIEGYESYPTIKFPLSN